MTTTTSSGQAHRRITAHKRFNRFVGAILRSPLHRVFSRRLLLLEVRGRRTGRVHAFPVGYLQEADTLYVLVAEYRTKTWWRNFQDGAGEAEAARTDRAGNRESPPMGIRRRHADRRP